MIIFKPDLRIVSCSRTVEQLFGYSIVELIAGHIGDLLIPGLDGAIVEAAVGAPAGREFVGRRRDGSTFTLELTFDKVGDGPTRTFIAILRRAPNLRAMHDAHHPHDSKQVHTALLPSDRASVARAFQPEPPHEGAKVKRALGVDQWAVRPLAWDMVLPETTDGFGLLFATRPVRLLRRDGEEQLRAGDLAVIDRQVPLLLMGEVGWTACLLELGNRVFGMRADRRAYRIGVALDGTTPLATTIKTLWNAGQDIDRLALADEVIDARMIDLIGSLARRLVTRDRDPRMTSHKATMIERAELMMTARLTDPSFSATTLAAQMRISQRHLSSLFAAVGTTTTKAILAHRLSRARNLLSDPANRQKQIAWIALESGFENQNYFARCFRREEGMTPRQFRERTRDSMDQ